MRRREQDLLGLEVDEGRRRLTGVAVTPSSGPVSRPACRDARAERGRLDPFDVVFGVAFDR
jgi:hypothetical protein